MGTLQPQVGGHPPTVPPVVLSFKDVLTTQAAISTPDLYFSPSDPDPATDPHPGKHKGSPAISFTRTHVSKLSHPFQWSLIGKFSQGYNKEHPNLGRPPVDQLQKHFEALDLCGPFQLGLLDNRHLLIQFQLQEDFMRMYSKPVWYIKGIPMRIFKWSSQFHVDKEPPLAPVWISLPRLPIHLFHRTALFAIAALIGAPLRMDSATASLKRPSTARVQLELNLLKERPSRIWISTEGEDGFWQKIDYESVPDYCQHCWHIGHSELVCHIHNPELKQQVEPRRQSKYVSIAPPVTVSQTPVLDVPPPSLPPTVLSAPVPSAAPLVSSLSPATWPINVPPAPVIVNDPLVDVPGPSSVPVVPVFVSSPPPLIVSPAPFQPQELSPVLHAQEIGFASQPIIEVPFAVDSEEDELIEADQVPVTVSSSDLLMVSDIPHFFPVVSTDDLTIGVWRSALAAQHGLSEARPMRDNLSREDLTRELTEFCTHISFKPPPKKRGRPPKSLFLQNIDPSPKPTHIMVTRSSRTASSHF